MRIMYFIPFIHSNYVFITVKHTKCKQCLKMQFDAIHVSYPSGQNVVWAWNSLRTLTDNISAWYESS